MEEFMANRLLVIEDDEQLLAVISEYFEALGYEVHRAVEREEADALLNNFDYSLVVTDLSLTKVGLEGLDLLKKISEQVLRPTVFVLSGHSSPDHREAALAKGADIFLQKPFPMLALGELVNRVLGVQT
jgi:two-component system alkaline phosphatase synthesis response regulator PhoP